MSQIKCSIIIPLHNGETTIRDTLESVVSQSDRIDEIIIIDDGSIDESKKIINAVLKTTTIPYRIISHQNPVGLARSYNEGIENAKHGIVVTMHQDIILKNSALEKLLGPFSSGDRTIVATTHTVDHPYLVWKRYNFWQKCLFSRLVDKKFKGLDGKFDAFRKDVLEGVGFFDADRFVTAGEDGDIIRKLRKKGRIVFTDAEIIHIHSMNPNFGIKQYIYKHAQYSEAQGTLFRRYGIDSIFEFTRIFFREILLLLLFVPYVRFFAAALIIIYAFLYTKRVFKEEWRNSAILILPFINIILLLVSSFYSCKGFIYGKQQL